METGRVNNNGLPYYDNQEYIEDAVHFAKQDYNNRLRFIHRFIDLQSVSNIAELGLGIGVLEG